MYSDVTLMSYDRMFYAEYVIGFLLTTPIRINESNRYSDLFATMVLCFVRLLEAIWSGRTLRFDFSSWHFRSVSLTSSTIESFHIQ